MKYLILIAMAGAMFGQQLDLSKLDALAAKATEVANVDLDGDKMKLAASLMPGDKEGKEITSQMKAISVRMFEFDKEGEYSPTDLDPIRSQLTGPNWSRIVTVKERKEFVEVWFYMEGGKAGGLAVLMGEPRELGVVNIVGPIDIQSLQKIAGSMIPPIKGLTDTKKPKPPAKDDE